MNAIEGRLDPEKFFPHPPLANRQHGADPGDAAVAERERAVVLRTDTRLTLSRGYREKLQERLGKGI